LHFGHAPPGIFVLKIIGFIHDKLLEKKREATHAGNMRRAHSDAMSNKHHNEPRAIHAENTRHAHADAMFKENRIEPRERIALPLNLENGGQAMTRDISASGLFFETDREQRVGGLIEFEIEFDRVGGLMKLKAQGQIVRIEPRAGKTGAALKFLVTRLEPVE